MTVDREVAVFVADEAERWKLAVRLKWPGRWHAKQVREPEEREAVRGAGMADVGGAPGGGGGRIPSPRAEAENLRDLLGKA